MHYFWLVFSVIFSSCIFAFDREKRYTEPAEIVAPGLLPWVVKMTDASGAFTGVLVSNKYIVTVAHVFDSDTDCLTAHFKNAMAPFSVKTSRYILHPKYDSSYAVNDYDFAIVELNQKISLDEQGIKLPVIKNASYLENDLYKISPVYAAAYADSDTLKKVILTWLSVKNGNYELNYAGHGELGDSGGALFYSVNNTAYLLGLHDAREIGLHDGNGVDGGINFYEAISKYLEFIVKNTDFKKSKKENWKDVVCREDVGSGSGSAIAIGIGSGIVVAIVGIVVINIRKELKETRLTGEAV